MPAANSLLKLLEEPPEDTVILLTSPAPGLPASDHRLPVPDAPVRPAARCGRRGRADRTMGNAGGESAAHRAHERGSLDRALELADGDFEMAAGFGRFRCCEAMVEKIPRPGSTVSTPFLKNTDKTEVQGYSADAAGPAPRSSSRSGSDGRTAGSIRARPGYALAAFLKAHPDRGHRPRGAGGSPCY
ncbi:MAG: hypothetical protein MZV64_02770 [Ignavibacteriales bacterium]|nr:hypothetical protein [Ignavibacteriales bacterium]